VIVPTEEFVLTGHVNVTLDLLDLIALLHNAQANAQVTDIVPMEFVIVDKVGEVILVNNQSAQIIVTIMENVLMENAIVVLDLLEMIALFVHAHQIATTTDNVLTSHANATMDTLDSIVLSNLAVLPVLEMDIVTMVHASANQDSQDFHAHFLLAHHHAQEMESVSQLELKWLVNVMLDSMDMIVPRNHVQVIALETENASTEFALVIMVGVVMIVLLVALDMDKDVVETENVLKDNAIVTLVGLVMVVT